MLNGLFLRQIQDSRGWMGRHRTGQRLKFTAQILNRFIVFLSFMIRNYRMMKLCITTMRTRLQSSSRRARYKITRCRVTTAVQAGRSSSMRRFVADLGCTDRDNCRFARVQALLPRRCPRIPRATVSGADRSRLARGYRSRTRRVCFGGMRRDGEKDGSDPILTRRHFAERLDGTGKM